MIGVCGLADGEIPPRPPPYDPKVAGSVAKFVRTPDSGFI